MSPHDPREEGRRYAHDLLNALGDLPFPLSRDEFLQRIKGRVIEFHDGRRLDLYEAMKRTPDDEFTSVRDVATDLVIRGAFRARTGPRESIAVEGAGEGPTGRTRTQGEGGPDVAGDAPPQP